MNFAKCQNRVNSLQTDTFKAASDMQKTLLTLALAAISLLPQLAGAALVARYSFDGNALDSSGNGNHGTVSGATQTTDRFGNAASAYAFNGSSAYIATSPLAYPSALNIGSQSWTISAWVNATTVSNSVRVIVGRYECGWYCAPGGPTNAALYNLKLVNGVPTFTVRDDTETLYEATAGSAISTDAWHLVTGVLDQGQATMSLYVDGTLSGSTALAAPMTLTDSGSRLEVGRWDQSAFASPTYYFAGTIDDVRIYNTALDANAVGALNAGQDPLPEPGSLALLGLGAAALVARRRHRPA